jgi:hypothetical protein
MIGLTPSQPTTWKMQISCWNCIFRSELGRCQRALSENYARLVDLNDWCLEWELNEDSGFEPHDCDEIEGS